MIPTFPEFARLSLDHHEPVMSCLKRLDAYSDFIFSSLWAWDINNDTAISTLNGNLVFRMPDYLSGEPIYSLIGVDQLLATIPDLCRFAAADGCPAALRLIPELTACLAATTVPCVTGLPDRDNFDYVYSLPQFESLHAKPYATGYRLLRRFARDYHPALRSLDLTEVATQRTILCTFESWRTARKKAEDEVGHELSALGRLLHDAEHFHLVALGLYVDGAMVGFNIGDVEYPNYAVSAFAKADTAFPGVFPYLESATAEFLRASGIEFWNWEQDLGLPGLRESKTRYHPLRFLRKYTITFGD